MTIYGVGAGDQTARALAAGDLNNDGRQDLVLGTALADGPNDSRPTCGEVYVLYGRSTWPSSIDLRNSDPSTTNADVTIFGAESGDHLGRAVAVGDVNGDNRADLVMGANGADGAANGKSESGEVYVIYGASLPSQIDLGSSYNPSVRLLGPDTGDNAGRALAIADFNGDGIRDLAVGVPEGGGTASFCGIYLRTLGDVCGKVS